MALNPRCYALSQISFLVTSITKKNYKFNSSEISSLIDKHGTEAEKHLFRCLLSQVDFSLGDGRNSSGKDGQQLFLLTTEANALTSRPSFVSVLCYGFENQENKSLRPINEMLIKVAKVLKLSRVQEVVFALGLSHSTDTEIKHHALQHLKVKLPELVRSYSDLSSGLEGGLGDMPIEVLHIILSHLLQSSEDEVGVSRESTETFVEILRRDFPRERVPLVLTPLLYQDQQDITEDRLVPVSVSLPQSVSFLQLADIVRDVGYASTSSKQDMLEILKDYGKALITPAVVARVLGMMAQTHTGLPESLPYLGINGDSARAPVKSPTSWDAKIFATALQALVPNLCWRDVIPELDYKGFHLPSPEGLGIVITAFNTACRDPFPIELIYGPWVHSEGQLSWFEQALAGCPDFSFTNYPFEPVNLEPLKNTFPNEEAKIWRSLNLIDTLLNLAEQGHYTEVKALFSVPVKQCADVLFIGLLQCKTTWHILQEELLSVLLPYFITNHPSSPAVLNYAWHSQVSTPTVQAMLMQAMADWYMQGDTPDQNRLVRILDVAQDLKVLPLMLKGVQFPFVIDLACWASRREFLKLDIWMVEKIKEHQESFATECIQFLVHRAPKPITPSASDRIGLSQDSITTMLSILQPFMSSLKPESAEKLRMLINIHGPIAPPKMSRTPVTPMMLPMMGSLNMGLDGSGVGGHSSSLSPGFGGSTIGMGVGALSSPGSPGKSSSMLPGLSGLSSGAIGTQPMSRESMFGGGGDPLQAAIGGGSGGGGMMSSLSQRPSQQSQTLMAMQHHQQQQQDTMDPVMYPSEQTFSKEVDERANAYFQAIYNRGVGVDSLLDLLKQFKDSPNKKERDLFVCMLRNMFEEYKFFPQFPEKELQITGQLFGGIIEHNLVTYMSLNLALRFVLDALKKNPSSKMFLFGLAALDKFKRRLKDLQSFCNSIANIPHFQQFPSLLRQYVQYGQQSTEPPSFGDMATSSPSASSSSSANPAGLGMMLGTQSTLPPLTAINTNPASSFQQPLSAGSPCSPVGPGGGQLSPSLASSVTKSSSGSPQLLRRDPPSINNTSIDTLLVAAESGGEKKQPPEDLQDKIHFLFNNLSANTLQQKIEEFTNLVGDEYYDWVAQYLVMKRASIEINFHNLYINFLDSVNNTRLRKMVLRETYRNIKVILQSDKTSNNFSDRAILKSLGKWLGLQTLAKNKPILHIDLGVKDLLLEAYLRGQQDLLYVVPFVAKVLEACADSRVFKPPNPWVMAIMSVLAELHAWHDLKLNLKFEVEVLCKHLSLEIQDIPLTDVLGNVEKASQLCQLVSNVREKQGGQNSSSPPQPLYHYEDISVLSLTGLGAHIQISPQISLLQQYPHLQQYIKPAIEKAVQDLLGPVVERSAKIALTTTEHIIKKDFSLDHEARRLHMAAVHMVRNLTAGMAMITCREPLLLSIGSNLKNAFTAVLGHASSEDQLKQLIEQATHQLSADNTELACAFIQKTAVEKVVPEMEKRLAEEIDVRQLARNERRQYCNPMALSYQMEVMPQQLRLNVGGPSQQQASVYDEFSRCLPGFLPSHSAGGGGKEAGYGKQDAPIQPFVATDEFITMLTSCIKEITNQVRMVPAPHTNHHVLMMRHLLDHALQLHVKPTYTAVISLLQKALEGLLEGMNPPPADPDMFVSFRDCHIIILRALQDHRALNPVAACRLVTKMLLETREDIKYSPRALILLIGLQLVDMKQLDEYLAKAVENGRNLVALSCSIKLVNAILSAEKRDTPITDNELKKTKETLFRLATNLRQLPESTAQLLEPFCREHDIRVFGDIERPAAASHPVNAMHQTGGVVVTSDIEDPPGLYEKVEYLLSEWVRHFHQPGLMRDGDKIYAAYVARLQHQGILKNDDLVTRFFRISIEMCVDLCYRTLADTSTMTSGMSRPKCYHTMDAFVKLVVVLVRYSGEPSNTVTKINLLNKVLTVVAYVLLKDHEARQTEFHQLAYHRFFIMLLNDICSPDPVFDAISLPMLQCFCSVYHHLRPSRAPGFAYAWLELISHRIFIAKLLLQTPQQKGWPLFHQLLIDLFKFLSPFLRNAELSKPTQLLYKGTLRVLLVLLHDFPEFLCDYHFSFCDVIPPNCIQMRNLILSAFPRNMRLPDPFTPNLKVELLPDIQHAPRILPTYTQLISANLKKDLDNYIKSRAPVTFLQELRGHLQVSSEPGKQYNISLMNALVLYVGTQAITFVHSKSGTPTTSSIAHTAHMDIFQHLVVDLDTEGRYLFLNAIANQLRYPNSHTHFFSCALISLFSETNHEAIQEQVTRVLLERLIVNRPHPWGLLITFIELIKNPHYNFWKHNFVHCAPEIEKLFESVAKSCMQKQPQPPSTEESRD